MAQFYGAKTTSYRSLALSLSEKQHYDPLSITSFSPAVGPFRKDTALSRHSGQSSARQIRLKARAHWKVATQNEKGNHLAYFNLVGQVSGKL